MKRNLTNADRKEIKTMTRMGYLIPTILMSNLIVWNIVFVLSDYFDVNNYILAGFNIGVPVICVVIMYTINRKYYRDLRSGSKNIKLKEVEAKVDKTSYEAGSGTLDIPLLSTLMPGLFSQKLTPNYIVYLIINQYRYKVTKKLFDSVEVGSKVEMHYSDYSNTLITIEKSRRSSESYRM